MFTKQKLEHRLDQEKKTGFNVTTTYINIIPLRFIATQEKVIMRTFIKQTRTIFHEFLIVQITTDLGGVKFLSRIFSLTPPI